ncbi:MAG: hypothetical protein JXB14_07485, partial [Candidatus Altiarchaeota archaeon]|nr:hypothetical protein [Candidatus Altiarchaeota archaeon]
VEEYINAGCYNERVQDLLNQAYKLYETSPQDSFGKALEARDLAESVECGSIVAPRPEIPQEHDQSFLPIIVAAVIIIVAAGLIGFKKKLF